jgi:DNA-binding response OmpR family regulator
MITAQDEKEYILEVIKLGITDYIVKPFTSETICQKIRTVLKISGGNKASVFGQ